MADALSWVGAQLLLGFANLYTALSNPMAWLNWVNDPESLIRFIYYGASKEFLFIIIDLFLVISKKHIDKPIMFFITGIIANISGTYLSNLVFFRLPLVPLILSLACASLSGGVGGLIAYRVFDKVKEMGLEL